MEFKIKLSENSKLRNFPEYMSEKAISLRRRYKEHNIARNFQIHDFTIDGDAINDLYQMREPIAKFAKKYKMKIDVYDPRTTVEIAGVKQSHASEDAKNYFYVVFTDLRNNKNFGKLIPARKDVFYPKVAKSKIACRVQGEQDLEIVRDVVSYSEDTCLRNFFRELENGAKRVLKKRETGPHSDKIFNLFI